jgi:hypothetical protein
MNMVLYDFVFIVNEVFKNQIWWPQGEDLSQVMVGFIYLCGLPLAHGAIDYTYIHIQELTSALVANFYSYKLKHIASDFKLLN